MKDAEVKNYICSEEEAHRQLNTPRQLTVEAGNGGDSLAIQTVPTVPSLLQ